MGINKVWSGREAVVDHGNCRGVGRREVGAGCGHELKLESNTDPGARAWEWEEGPEAVF